VVKVVPLPEAGLPPVAVHAKLYGIVPPEPVAVKETAVPTVPDVGPETVTARANPGPMGILVDAVAVFVLAEVTVTDTVKVPFTL